MNIKRVEQKIYKIKSKVHLFRKLIEEFYYDLIRYYKYTSEQNIECMNEERFIGRIVLQYHIIEKGLTMPEMRKGFGREILLDLLNNCEFFVKKFSNSNCQVKHAISVLNEYVDVHLENGYELDVNLTERIRELCSHFSDQKFTKQLYFNSDEFFKYVNSSFAEFARSRHSLRNFGNKDVPDEEIVKALELAQTTPTSCNRQPIRIRIISNNEILEKIRNLHTGSRGFGHLVKKMILISADLNVYNEPRERNLIYIDSGLYAMNLLYALHYYRIGACALNCAFERSIENQLRTILEVPDNEIISLLIAIGYPPKHFKVTRSKRYKPEQILIYVK